MVTQIYLKLHMDIYELEILTTSQFSQLRVFRKLILQTLSEFAFQNTMQGDLKKV
jgi:hypothetical protein